MSVAKQPGASGTAVSRSRSASAKHARVANKRLRIGLFGLFGSGNFGNDASLDSALTFVRQRRPDAALICICGTPEIIEPRFKIQVTRISCPKSKGWKAALNRWLCQVPREIASTVNALLHLWRLDTMIIPGTGILDDFGTGPFGMPYAMFRWCLLARIVGTKVLFLNVGAGPISHPLSRFFMKAAARLANYRSYRDEISRQYMERIGVNAKDDPVYPDVAFGLPLPVRTSHPSNRLPPVIGVGLMSYNGWRGDIVRRTDIYDTYMLKITSFVKRVLDEGYRVRLLSGDEHDWDAVEDLTKRLQIDHPKHLNDKLITVPVHSFYDVMQQIADTHIVIATRYHNVVAALIMNKPTLSIGYAAKNDVLLGQMGLGNYCQHIEAIDLDLLMVQLHQLLDNREHHEKILRKTNRLFRRRLFHQQEALLHDFFPSRLDHHLATAGQAMQPRGRNPTEFNDANK